MMFTIHLTRTRLLTLLIAVFVLVTVPAATAGERKENRKVYRWGQEKSIRGILKASKVNPLVRAAKEKLAERQITTRIPGEIDAAGLSN